MSENVVKVRMRKMRSGRGILEWVEYVFVLLRNFCHVSKTAENVVGTFRKRAYVGLSAYVSNCQLISVYNAIFSSKKNSSSADALFAFVSKMNTAAHR